MKNRLPLFIFVLALSVRLWQLGKQSIWMDEAFSVWVSSHSVPEILKILKMDTHPPLFYWFLHEWHKIAGFNDFWLRFPFAVFGALNALLIYRLVEKIGNRKLAVLTSFFWIASFYAQYMETQVRMYSMALFFSLAATLFFVDAIRKPVFWRWSLYVIFAMLSIYTHYYCGLVLIVHFIYLFIKGRFKEACFLAASMAVLFLPWISIFLFQKNSFTGWKSIPVEPLSSLEFFSTLFGASLIQSGKAYNDIANLLAVAIVIFSSIVVFRKKKGEEILFGLLVIIPLVLLIFFYHFQISFVQWLRHIMFFAPYFYYLCALALLSLSRFIWIPLLACYFSMNLFLTYLFGTGPAFERQNWRALDAYLKPRLKAGDSVWVEQILSIYPLWYYNRDAFDINFEPKDGHLFIRLALHGNTLWEIGDQHSTSSQMDQVSQSSNRIWLVLCQEIVTDPQEHLLGWLKTHRRLVFLQHYRSLEEKNDIRLFLFINNNAINTPATVKTPIKEAQ